MAKGGRYFFFFIDSRGILFLLGTVVMATINMLWEHARRHGNGLREHEGSGAERVYGQSGRVTGEVTALVAPVEGRLRRSVPSLPAIKPDRLKTAKALVEKAVKLRKVFSVQGPYPVIRAALWARGWVERRLPHPVQRAPHCHGDEEEDGDDVDVIAERVDEGEKEENLDDMYDLMSRLVRNETTHFYWTTRRDDIDCRTLRHDQMTNHYANAGTFTTKVGLCVNLRNLQWFDTADPDTFFPRCYRLGAEDEKRAFIELDNAERRCVGPGMIDMALRTCEEFLNVLEHGDIDVTVDTHPSVEEQQWAEFLQDYYMVVHEGASITCSSVFVERCQAMLIRLHEVCPQLDTDGLNNIWIIKPGAKSRGRGIMCMDRLDEILALVDSDRALTKESKWVVQKYLERPLLVHGTKFDLRQWFLVTDWNPLTVWFYRECYLRFSTQPYSTKTLDRSFLQQQGRGAEWESVVVPGMQQAVVRALQTAQDLIEPRKASFELYGADFMLGRDLRPWLLEINASPTYGLFHRCDCSPAAVEVPQYVGVNLLVEGAPIRRSRPPLNRQNIISNQAVTIQCPSGKPSSEEVETAHHKASGQKSSAVSTFQLPRSGKENRAAGEKKRQLISASPKRECEGRTEVQNTSCVRRSCRGLVSEQPLVLHTEPQRKARTIGFEPWCQRDNSGPKEPFLFSQPPSEHFRV
ncbi:Tubulin monoglycylase TTLL3 [Nibea albiflora]|uniref:Tubulin monoglycylase TTLL3 n=1 Tax=Nibea albiflora TaxID=240163 RepID=A0ACB7F0W5_NIBAL|nr:Tubulin monoglycylase TTLL3 [Nibea albiflora]